MADNESRARLDQSGIAARGRGLRGCRDRGDARRPGGPRRSAWAERRAWPRPPRRLADRAQFLFGRYPRRADGVGVAARWAFRVIARRALRPGARLLSETSR